MWRRRLFNRDARRQLNRVAATAAPGEQYSLYRLRFRPAKGSFRRAVGYGATAVVCYLVWNGVTAWPLRHLDPELKEEIKRRREEREPWFLTLPFTEKQVESVPYSGRGEEWQSFVEFNKDAKRREQVNNELMALIKKVAEQSRVIRRYTGGAMPITIGPALLTFTYPLRPPPEFVRWVIQFNHDSIELKTRPLDARTKALIDRMLVPYPMMSGAAAFAKAFFQEHVNAISNYFGYNTSGNKPSITIETQLKAKKMMDAHRAALNASRPSPSSESRPSPSPSPSPSASEPDRPPPRSGHATPNTAASGREASKPSDKDAGSFSSPLPATIAGPWQAFKENFLRAWQPLRFHPPRGCILVQGIVCLDTPKGRAHIDVKAWYHPKARKFHYASMFLHMRAFTPLKQSPLRN